MFFKIGELMILDTSDLSHYLSHESDFIFALNIEQFLRSIVVLVLACLFVFY